MVFDHHKGSAKPSPSWAKLVANLIPRIGHDFPGAQAMLYAAGVPNREIMKSAPQVG